MVVIAVFCSCAPKQPVDRVVVIENYVSEKIESYKTSRLKSCREVALSKATEIVDSLLIERARLEKDTFGKPGKPEKPPRPEIKTPIDTTPIRPLFGN